MINTDSPQQDQHPFIFPLLPQCLLHVPGNTGDTDKRHNLCSQRGQFIGNKQAKKLFLNKGCTLCTGCLLWKPRGDTTQLTAGTEDYRGGKLREASNARAGTLPTSFPTSSSAT